MLNWYNFVFIFFSIVNFAIFILLLLKPHLLQPILVAIVITTSAIEIYQRQFGGIFSLSAILLALIILLLTNKIKLVKKKQKLWDIVHQKIFLLMTAYFMIQAIRGIFFYENLGINYWVIYGWFFYFAVLGLFAFMLSYNNLPKIVNISQLSFIIVTSCLAFFICYISIGFFVEKTGLNFADLLLRDLQHLLTSDTTQVSFLLVIAFPAALFLLKNPILKRRRLIIIILLFTAAFIYAYFWSSRFAWLIITLFFIAGLITLSHRRKILWILVPLLILMLNFQYIIRVPQMLSESIASILNPTNTTTDRSGAIIKSLSIINKPGTSAIFGYGINSYKTYLSTTFAPGLAVILIDTGLLGLMLLILNFIFVGKKILMQKDNPHKIIPLLALGLTASFLLVGQSLTNTLFYFLIMPEGLLIQLNKAPQKLL